MIFVGAAGAVADCAAGALSLLPQPLSRTPAVSDSISNEVSFFMVLPERVIEGGQDAHATV